MSSPERPASGLFDHEVEPDGAAADLPPAERSAPEADGPPPSRTREQPAVREPAAPVADEPAPVVEPLVQPQPAQGEHAAGELRVPGGIRTFSASPNGSRRSVGIAVARFNGGITSRLLDGALDELQAAGVVREAIDVMPVPGAFELPLAAMALAKSRRYSCVLALGCVIRGETPHFDYVSAEAASGVQLAGLETGVPVSFGVLTCDTLEQAEARAGGEHGNKGAEAARSALEMVEALGQLRATLAS